MKNKAWLGLLLLTPLLLANQGCDTTPTADQKDRQQTAALANQASTVVGMPAITRFNEKRQVKMLYELRDNADLATVAYIVDLDGGLHKLCDSAGYGIPYSTQFTNPERPDSYNGNPYIIAQPEPNGLFMPDSADGTWIMCLDPASKKVAPVFVEPRVIVSPFPLALAKG